VKHVTASPRRDDTIGGSNGCNLLASDTMKMFVALAALASIVLATAPASATMLDRGSVWQAACGSGCGNGGAGGDIWQNLPRARQPSVNGGSLGSRNGGDVGVNRNLAGGTGVGNPGTSGKR
jgi:hypothetical protein